MTRSFFPLPLWERVPEGRVRGSLREALQPREPLIRPLRATFSHKGRREEAVARPGLGRDQRGSWLKNRKNPKSSAPACRAGWKIVARRRLPPRARWSIELRSPPARPVSSRWKRRRWSSPTRSPNFSPTQDRPNEGVFSFQDDDEQWDIAGDHLTVPLARYVAENFDALPKPYRSYRFGYVFRNEKPGPGRFRQFMQFDADTVGSGSPAADAEMCMMAADTMEALGIPRGSYVVKVNNRKVLDGVMESIGLGGPENARAARLTVLRAIDKLDRLGSARRQGVARGKVERMKAEILRKGLASMIWRLTYVLSVVTFGPLVKSGPSASVRCVGIDVLTARSKPKQGSRRARRD